MTENNDKIPVIASVILSTTINQELKTEKNDIRLCMESIYNIKDKSK